MCSCFFKPNSLGGGGGSLPPLSPILTLEFFPLAEFLQIWPWFKYISLFAKYCLLWIFSDKSHFWTFGFSLLSFDKSSVQTPPIYFCPVFPSKLRTKTKKMKSRKDPGHIFIKIILSTRGSIFFNDNERSAFYTHQSTFGQFYNS